MEDALYQVVNILRSNACALRARGIVHAAVFGSVARGGARPDGDIHLLVDLESGGVFEYVRLQHDVAALCGRRVDLVELRALKPLLHEPTIRDRVDAF